MDLSDWKTLNSNIVLKHTKKKFFNRYYYNIRYWCPGGRIILGPDRSDIELLVEYRQSQDRNYNYGGSWRSRLQTNKMNVHQLTDMRNVKSKYLDVVKFRVEEPHITLYSDKEELLYDIASNDLRQWSAHLDTIHKPITEDVKSLLDSGAILFKKPINYKYKIICRDGYCQNKSYIYNYLDNLQDQVKVSNTVWTMLEKQSNHIWGVWFYTNDVQLAEFLNIIEPNFVLNIHEVVVV